MEDPVAKAIQHMKPGRWLLAVSGGRDSMVLLEEMWRRRRREIAAVATFDHGTGPAATRAVSFVHRQGRRFELEVVSGLQPLTGKPTEDSLRKSRWEFLNATARTLGARVVTAHSLDDHAETTFIRILRDAHARGIAGMLVPSAIERPLLLVRRDDIARYAEQQQVEWVEDPSNALPGYLRNRVRNEILPTVEKLRPGFTQWLLVTSARGAAWRRGLSDAVDHLTRGCTPGTIPISAMDGMTPEAAAIIWPEVASRVGVTLDWRGIERLGKEARKLKQGAEIPLSAGASCGRTVTTYVIRNRRGRPLY